MRKRNIKKKKRENLQATPMDGLENQADHLFCYLYIK
jgi:hypothetical protein